MRTSTTESNQKVIYETGFYFKLLAIDKPILYVLI